MANPLEKLLRAGEGRILRRLQQVVKAVNALEEDYAQLSAAREAFAPNQVCSAVRLIQGCMTDDNLEQQLPASLRALLRERNLQRAFFDGKSRAA